MEIITFVFGILIMFVIAIFLNKKTESLKRSREISDDYISNYNHWTGE